MKKFIDTIKNIYSIEELRNRILYTIGFLVIFRIGSYIVLPGVDPEILSQQGGSSGILGVIDNFLGGAFSRASIFGLGIMPYITASIALQLLQVAIPKFQKLKKEGESGQRKITQYTRLLTIIITMVQAPGYLAVAVPQEAIMPGVSQTWFTVSSMIILTSGTVFCMWLGEKISDKGIGNGISMLIMIGIISRLPAAVLSESATKGMDGALLLLVEFLALFFVVMGVVLITQATRRIPVQYAKQAAGSRVYGGQRQFLPLKVNAAGVMPIIFAQSLMFLPAMIASFWSDSSEMAQYIGSTFTDHTSWQYNLVFAVLIIVFTFFYTAITVDPKQIADDMKRNGGFVPGVKPGKPTADFIDTVLTRITLPGSIFIALIAVMPAFASAASISREFSQFYGGTSLLIMVGVILDTLRQIESYLLMRHYEGMMRSGKVKGQSHNAAVA